VIDWAIPWSTDEVIDFIFLVVSALVIIAVPVLYGAKANLRDPLARAVVAGTGSTGIAFAAAIILTVALHTGWTPPEQIAHWITRALYVTVALGKMTLLVAIVRVIRDSRRERAVALIAAEERAQ
jgi:hypothetical protein